MEVLILTDTWLKARPIDSSRLGESEKRKLSQGTSLAVKSGRIEGEHYYFEFSGSPGEFGSGYLYRAHVEVIQPTTAIELIRLCQDPDEYHDILRRAQQIRGGLDNTCVAFSSECLRRIGHKVPVQTDSRGENISLVTRPYLRWLEANLSLQRIDEPNNLQPGDMCFSLDEVGYPGYPAHVYYFLRAADDDFETAYVCDNQGRNHLRNLIDWRAPARTPFQFAIRLPQERAWRAFSDSNSTGAPTGEPSPEMRAEYEKLFSTLTYRANRQSQITRATGLAKANRSRYGEVATQTGVPWYVIAVIHSLESNFDFRTHLHNGDPLSQRTVHVPVGRPASGTPPYRWEESAVDALAYDDLDSWTDWSLGGTLYKLEGYNGFGYRRHKINTPYLWSFCNHYTKGKFTSDREYDPEAVSNQCGAAVILRKLADDGEIVLP